MMKTRERIDKTDGKITRRKISLITQESMTNKQAHTHRQKYAAVLPTRSGRKRKHGKNRK